MIELHGWTDLVVPAQAMLDLTSREYRLYNYLIFRARGKKGAFPGIKRIAQELTLPDEKWSEPTVKRMLKNLAIKGYVYRSRRFAKSTMTYIFKSPKDCETFISQITHDPTVRSPMIPQLDHARSDRKSSKKKENTEESTPPPAGADSELDNVIAAYERYIGTVSPIILKAMSRDRDIYSAAWLIESFEITQQRVIEGACKHPSYQYAIGICKRWLEHGYDGEIMPSSSSVSDWI